MTDIETRITTYPALPIADITPLERLILSNVLDCSETEDGFELFTDFGPRNPVRVRRKDLIESFQASERNIEILLRTFVTDSVLAQRSDDGDDPESIVEIDLSAFPWQFIVQDIIARSTTARELVVIQWINHPSQRPDTFGASVSLITANGIFHATSDDLISHFRRQDQILASAASDEGALSRPAGDRGATS